MSHTLAGYKPTIANKPLPITHLFVLFFFVSLLPFSQNGYSADLSTMTDVSHTARDGTSITTTRDRPNVLLIMCDDLNDYSGAFGGHQFEAQAPAEKRFVVRGGKRVTCRQARYRAVEPVAGKRNVVGFVQPVEDFPSLFRRVVVVVAHLPAGAGTQPAIPLAEGIQPVDALGQGIVPVLVRDDGRL